MKTSKLVLIAAMSAGLSFGMFAQDKYSAGDYDAAYKLIDAAEIQKSHEKSLHMMLEMQTKNLPPQLASLKPDFIAFFNKYLNFKDLKKDYAEIYLKNFTPGEIKELTAFYQTPIGKKLAEKQTLILTEGAQLGQKRIQPHIPELQKLIRAKLAEKMKKQTPAALPAK